MNRLGLLVGVLTLAAVSLVTDRSGDRCYGMLDQPGRDTEQLTERTPQNTAPDIGDLQVTTRLTHNGFVRAQNGTAGTLRLSLSGEAAMGRGPHVIVNHANHNLWEGLVTERKDLRLALTDPGPLVIAFVNDRSDADGDRNLWISDLSFEPH